MGIVERPSGGLMGSSNYNLYSSCADLTDVSVTIDVTHDMIAIPTDTSADGMQSNGIAFQLNCLPQAGGSVTWQQYVLVVSRTGGNVQWGVNNWNTDPADSADGFIDAGGDLATLNTAPGPGYARIPAGYRIKIALNNDPVVSDVTFSMWDEHGAAVFPATNVKLTTLADVNGNPVTDGELTPIVDIMLVITGYANRNNTTLSQGAGTITYRAGQPLTVLNTFPARCTNGVNTAESSNVGYGELDSTPGAAITQSFEASFYLAGKPACLYATGANNQQHVFIRGTYGTPEGSPYGIAAGDTDGGIYNIFYDPGDNKIHGPEAWAWDGAGYPAALYATGANNQQHMFYRGTDGELYNVFYDPGDNQLHGFYDPHDNPATRPKSWAKGVLGTPAALYATGANNQQHVFYRDADGGLWNVFYDPGDNQVHGPAKWGIHSGLSPVSDLR